MYTKKKSLIIINFFNLNHLSRKGIELLFIYLLFDLLLCHRERANIMTKQSTKKKNWLKSRVIIIVIYFFRLFVNGIGLFVYFLFFFFFLSQVQIYNQLPTIY